MTNTLYIKFSFIPHKKDIYYSESIVSRGISLNLDDCHIYPLKMKVVPIISLRYLVYFCIVKLKTATRGHSSNRTMSSFYFENEPYL